MKTKSKKKLQYHNEKIHTVVVQISDVQGIRRKIKECTSPKLITSFEQIHTSEVTSQNLWS